MCRTAVQEEGKWFVITRGLHQVRLQIWTNSPMRERLNGFPADQLRQSSALIAHKVFNSARKDPKYDYPGNDHTNALILMSGGRKYIHPKPCFGN